jgi:DNA primase small subunit
MGRTVPLVGPALGFCRTAFRRYYEAYPPAPPPDLPRREIAFSPFDTPGMFRHLAYAGEGEFRGALLEAVPRHAYYSTAYYQRPAHPIMKEKGWEGADVIFDLDADHLRDAERLSYPQQLELVKVRFRLLLDEYLFDDFGLTPADVQLVFSGGRGYHAHIRAHSFRELTSAARRELVDYLTGEGFEPLRESLGQALEASPTPDRAGERPRTIRPSTRRPRQTAARLSRLAPPDAPGWQGRFTRSLFRLTEHWEPMDPETLRAELLSKRSPEGTPWFTEREAKELSQELLRPGTLAKVRERLTLDVFRQSVLPSFLGMISQEAALELRGEADAPVTTDVHRLIRLPGSLHGGTGFRVVPLTRESLEDFSPWRDALSLPDAQGPQRVLLEADVDYPFPGRDVKGHAGELLTLDPAPTLFLLLRGEASLPPPTG